nr:hypothetical protein [Tanacetum cinerariifolium]
VAHVSNNVLRRVIANCKISAVYEGDGGRVAGVGEGRVGDGGRVAGVGEGRVGSTDTSLLSSSSSVASSTV